MNQFMTGLYNFVSSWSPLIYMLVAIALIIAGIMFIIPSDKIHAMAIKSLPGIVIGAGIVALATTIAQEVSSAFVF